MFENIIAQGAVDQLRADVTGKRDVPSMLFFGPPCSGKGSAALELSRVYSCEEKAAWKCACPACEKHWILAHDDLLLLGSRGFSSDIHACRSSFLRNAQNQGVKLLFYRSLRKVQLRFSPVVMENDSKTAKTVSSVLLALDEGLNDLLTLNTQTCEQKNLEKLSNSLVKDALKLEEEGLSDSVPVGHIRSASYWCRLAPNGKRKVLIIENADNLRDDALNSLLKLLEEPPETVSIILTAQRREAIMPTILSRVRPYRFLKRDIQSEKEVIRRVFQDTSEEGLAAYLESFLRQSSEKLQPLADWFASSLKDCVQGRGVKSASVIKEALSKSNNFKDISFSVFMKAALDSIIVFLRGANDRNIIAHFDLLKKYINDAVCAVDVYNISAVSALEALFHKLKTDPRRYYG